MANRQPPTNDAIREYVEQILEGADLEKLTMRRVCKQVCRHFPGFDLTHRKDYIKATIMSVINSEPNMAQVEKLLEFIEKNPEMVTGTDQAENAPDKLQTVEKWDAIAIDLNSLGGEIKSGESWAKFWGLLKVYINRIIAEKKSECGSRRIVKLYPRAMTKRMIMLLEGGPRNEEIPADSPTDDEIVAYVEQILYSVDLEKMWMETVYNHVCSHYPGLDLVQQKDFIKATIKSTITSRPSIAQMEKLVKFLEENPDIARGTGQAENDHESLQANHKWEAIANELNMLEGKNRCSDSWEDFWDILRSHLKQIIAGRQSVPGFRGGVLLQLYSRTVMEQMIKLLGGPADEDITAPSDAEIKEFVEQILHGADLEKVTRQTVYKQVFRQFPGIDLAHKKGFIKAKIMSAINSQPSIAQMEKLVKFLEENPDIARGTGQAENDHESLQTTQKWEALANELNLMEGEKRTGDSWAEFWDLLRTHLNQIIADRNSLPGFSGGSLHQYPRAMMEHLIMLLGGPGNLDIPPAPSNDEIKKYVKRVYVDLERIWRKTMYKQVCSYYPDIEHKKDFIKATIKSVTQAHIISKHAVRMEHIHSGNAFQFGEAPSTSRQDATAAKLARIAAERSRRTKARAMRRPAPPPAAAERLFNIDEGRLQVNLKSAEALSSFGATAEHIGAFIAACSNTIALEIEHRNTPN